MNAKLGFLGILFRANKARIGDELDKTLLKANLVIVASNAMSNTAQAFTRRLSEHAIPFKIEFTKEELGSAVGRNEVNFIGIYDSKAAKAYLRKGE